MYKHILAAAMLLTMSALLLSACGEKKQEEAQSPQGSQTADYQAAQEPAAMEPNDDGAAAEQIPDAQPVEEPTYDEINQNGDENPSDEEDGDDEASWNGSFTSASGETLTLEGADGSTVSFAFAQCGISGSAQKDANTGNYVYHGDDSAVIIFSLSGDTIDVSVTSEEDYDMSESPMIGSYGRN